MEWQEDCVLGPVFATRYASFATVFFMPGSKHLLHTEKLISTTVFQQAYVLAPEGLQKILCETYLHLSQQCVSLDIVGKKDRNTLLFASNI